MPSDNVCFKNSQPPAFIFDMASEKTKRAVKICGYLEKRGKLSITGKWKKWWCVLDGQLLLYYKSRRQYLKLSPCCGSLNVALVKSIQPHCHRRLHLATHSQLVVLRASSKEKQQNWFLAFVNILQQNKFQALISEPPDCKLKVYEQYCDYCRNNSSKYCDYNFRAPRESDFDADFRSRSRKVELIEDMEDESPLQSPAIDRTSSNHIKWEGKSGMTDMKQFSSQESLASTTSDDDDPQLGMDVRMKRFYSVQCVKDSACDITLSTEKSFSYHSIVHYEYRDLGHFTAKCESQFKNHINRWSSKDEIMCGAQKRSKESFNFLRKVFSNNLRRKTSVHKLDSDAQTYTKKDDQKTVGERLHNQLDNQSDELAGVVDKCTCSDEENIAEMKRDRKKPKHTEECTPSTGAAGFTRNSERHSIAFPFGIMLDTEPSEESPILPVKRKINTAMYSSKIAELNSGAYDSIRKNFAHESKHACPNLDLMLQQLSMITQDGSGNESSDEGSNEEEEEDPDYDIPIPHASLIRNKPANDSSHNFRLGHSSYFHMTPDSLEAPWVNRWSTPNHMFGTSDDQPGSDCDVSLDSLMTPYSRR